MAQAQEKLGKTVTVRTSPQLAAGNTSTTVKSILPLAIVDYDAIVDDLQHPHDPNYQWLRLATAKYGSNQYVNYFYPSGTVLTLQRFTLISVPPPAPTKTHTIEVFSDGSIQIDGKPVP